MSMVNWGTALGRRGEFERAAALKRTGLRHVQQVHGPRFMLSAIIKQRLAEELFRLGDLDGASATLDSELSFQESISPRNLMELCVALRLRGAIQTIEGEFAVAGRTLARARGLLDSLGAVRTVPEVGVRLEFAKLYEATGRAPMALSELERALSLSREKLGPTHVTTLVALGRLAEFAARTGDPSRAASLRADSAATVARADAGDR